MTNNDELARLLASIDRRLALLSAEQDRDLRQALRMSLLRTPARITMFEALDGRRGSGELAKLATVSARSAQLFIKEMLELGLVRPVDDAGSRTVVVERDEAAVLDWYLQSRADS